MLTRLGDGQHLSVRSLEFNDELNLVVMDEVLAKDIRTRMFDVDIAKSRRIESAEPSLCAMIDRLLSPWI